MTQEEFFERLPECPWRERPIGESYVCTRYFGTLVPCDGACSFVVDYPNLKELETKRKEG